VKPRRSCTFFNGGVRSRAGALQINDTFADERGIVDAVDRFSGGLYTLELPWKDSALPRVRRQS
jgi:hypothetical protein